MGKPKNKELIAITVYDYGIHSFLSLTPNNSYKWPRENFSLQYQYKINQISDENKEKYQFGIISWSNTKFAELTL